jgi:hypothetical protein
MPSAVSLVVAPELRLTLGIVFNCRLAPATRKNLNFGIDASGPCDRSGRWNTGLPVWHRAGVFCFLHF